MKSTHAQPVSIVKTVSWPLALAFICLIIYASLYPFTDWRNQGISPLIYLTAPLPKYWSGFDVVANVLGYGPLGFLLTLAGLRSGHIRWAVWLAVLGAMLMSLSLETLQSYLPSRIPSSSWKPFQASNARCATRHVTPTCAVRPPKSSAP